MGINNAVGGYQYLSRDVYRDIREELKKKKKKDCLKISSHWMCTRRPIIFILSLGIYCKHDKSDRLKKKKEKKSFEYYNIIQNNEMIIAIYK